MDKQRILIIDDDSHIADILNLYLTKECFETRIEDNGEDGLKAFHEFSPHLILLDLMLPGIDGYEVCREIRKESNLPIIMLSAKGEVFDEVLGLELGADDYIIKPFECKSVIARVRACLRRVQREDAAPRETASEKCVVYGSLRVNLDHYSVEKDGMTIDMAPKELELLYYLASSPNQVFTRDQLLDKIWGYEFIGDSRTIDVHIKRIREKIGRGENWSLDTVYGIGYKFHLGRQS